jgi:acetyltransferase-like isoleucine patch superfamily enzyme
MRGFERGRIHPTAIVSESAVLASDVTLGANVIVYDHVTLGAGAVVGPNSILGEPAADYYASASYDNPPLVIGPRALIRSGAVIYGGTSIGSDFECGHRVTIREKARIGDHCRIGTLDDIQGHCVIGDYARFHSNVHVSQGTTIGKFVWIFPFTTLLNDPQPPSTDNRGPIVEDFAVIATSVVVAAGVRIGRDSFVAARSVVTKDVSPETMVIGSPARPVIRTPDIKSAETGEPMYPWRNHFDRGMPWAGIGFDVWKARQGDAPRQKD